LIDAEDALPPHKQISALCSSTNQCLFVSASLSCFIYKYHDIVLSYHSNIILDKCYMKTFESYQLDSIF